MSIGVVHRFVSLFVSLQNKYFAHHELVLHSHTRPCLQFSRDVESLVMLHLPCMECVFGRHTSNNHDDFPCWQTNRMRIRILVVCRPICIPSANGQSCRRYAIVMYDQHVQFATDRNGHMSSVELACRMPHT